HRTARKPGDHELRRPSNLNYADAEPRVFVRGHLRGARSDPNHAATGRVELRRGELLPDVDVSRRLFLPSDAVSGRRFVSSAPLFADAAPVSRGFALRGHVASRDDDDAYGHADGASLCQSD